MEAQGDSIIVDVNQAGGRLDALLATLCPTISRSQWKGLILDGAVWVNGGVSKPNQKIKVGDALRWTLPELDDGDPLAEDIPIDVLYEDDAVLVLNKPAGLVVHPAAGNKKGTLVNGLLFHDATFQLVERAGIVHRLDKDTSGVMVVAKTPSAFSELQRQFKARETQKEYLALVWGAPPPEGRIETQIGRHPVHRKKMAVLREGGRQAISHYRVLEQFEHVALVRVQIATGRTHQIRVHMTHLGHPVVGDSVYCRARKLRFLAPVERQMLHAAQLEFLHPSTKEPCAFEAPLWDDMQALLDQLRGQ